MKLHWFLNNNELFESDGDMPFIGQTVYINDYTLPINSSKKYKVNKVSRSISLGITNTANFNIATKDPGEKVKRIIELTEELGTIYAIKGNELKYSTDIAQINLELDNSK